MLYTITQWVMAHWAALLIGGLYVVVLSVGFMIGALLGYRAGYTDARYISEI